MTQNAKSCESPDLQKPLEIIFYTLNKLVLAQVVTAKYCGIRITENNLD